MIHLEHYLTVTALTKYIKAKLEGDKHLFSIYLKGEISNFKRHSKGHLYFTLKDENAQISGIMFSTYANQLNFSPKEGDHVLVTGRISLYEPSGSYSIQVSKMELDGIGELYLKYEALKKELEEKGYFNNDRKRQIPKFPKKIGVVTSPTGAVIEDIKNTVSRRYLLTEIHLYPALVQGPGSANSIKEQIELANIKMEVDVLIVGRGGGSIEDLWGFNEMPVIEAIYQSKIPIITAIGHETDYTISDFVSDLRAPTPTAAAELATPNKEDLLVNIKDLFSDIEDKINQLFYNRKTVLVHLDERLDVMSPLMKLKQLRNDITKAESELNFKITHLIELKKREVDTSFRSMKKPHEKILISKERCQYLSKQLEQKIIGMMDLKSYQFQLLKASLEGRNPLKMMDKGFAIVEKNNEVITSIKSIKKDDQVTVKFNDGSFDAKVNEVKGE